MRAQLGRAQRMARSVKAAQALGPSHLELDVGKLRYSGLEALGLTHRARRTRYKNVTRGEAEVLLELLRERVAKLPPCVHAQGLLRKVTALLSPTNDPEGRH